MPLRMEIEGLVPSLSAHSYSQNGQFTPAIPGSPYTKKEARAALIHREDRVGKAYMYFSSEQPHSQFIFIAVFQLNALVSLCSAFCFLSKHCSSHSYICTEKRLSGIYIPLVEMLHSNIIAIQHQDIKDVDGTDFSLGFPLRRAIQRFIIHAVAISACFLTGHLFQQESTFPDIRNTQFPCCPLYRNMASSKNQCISNTQFCLSGGRESGTTAAIHRYLCLIKYHKAQHTTVSLSEMQDNRETPRQLGFFTLHCKYTMRIFSSQSPVTTEQLCTHRATDT